MMNARYYIITQNDYEPKFTKGEIWSYRSPCNLSRLNSLKNYTKDSCENKLSISSQRITLFRISNLASSRIILCTEKITVQEFFELVDKKILLNIVDKTNEGTLPFANPYT